MPSCPAALILIPHYPHQFFTYVIPDTLQQKIHAGNMVRVPFGSNVHVGLVAEIIATTATTHLKAIEDIVDASFELSPSMLSLARWMASYYLAPMGACLQLMLPPMFRHGIKERFIITPLGRMMAAGSGRGRATQHAILTRLQSAKHGLSSQYLRRQLGHRRMTQALATLKRNGHIDAHLDLPSVARNAQRANGRRTQSNPANAADVTQGNTQHEVPLHSPLASAIQQGKTRTFILQAPREYRASVYLKAIQKTMRKGKSSIVIFPHTSHARAIAKTMSCHLGDRMSEWFGTRTSSRRTSEWYRVQSGEANVVIGTRLTVFSPAKAVGLIIVDDEHDFRHKVDQEPRFHTREIALARAIKDGATVILGSLHPSVEAIHMTQSKKATLLVNHPMYSTTDLDRVSHATSHVSVQCIDMKTAPKTGRLFSETLLHAMHDCLKNRKPVILYQPRRGFSRSL